MAESSPGLAIVGTTDTIRANSVHPLLADGGADAGEESSPTIESEASVASPDTTSSDALSGEGTKAPTQTSSQQADALDWKSPFLDAKTPEEFFDLVRRNEKTRPLLQSEKDREIGRARTQLEQQYQSQLRAQQEQERLDSLTPEELGNEFRTQQQIRAYEDSIKSNAQNEWMVEGYRQTMEHIGPEAWQKVVDAVGNGQLQGYGQIVAYAAQMKAEELTQATLAKQDQDLAKRVEERVQLELAKRTANGHLAETSPDTSRPIMTPGAKTYAQSDIDKLPWDYAITNPKEMADIEKAFYSGRVVQGR